jgi:hypothetical protein
MLAIIPGMIAGSALTKSANQVPNVVTQVSVATCAFVTHVSGGGWNAFGACMAGIWGVATTYGALSARAQRAIDLLRVAVRFVRTNPWGLVATVA